MADKLMIVIGKHEPVGSRRTRRAVLPGRGGGDGLRGRDDFDGARRRVREEGHSGEAVCDDAFVKDVPEAGVRFKVCKPALDLWGNDLIPEIDEIIGGAYVIQQAMDDRVVTFTY